MKTWQIAGFPALLIFGFLLVSACTTTTPDEVSTPTPQIVYVTVTVLVTPTPGATSYTLSTVTTSPETKEAVDAKLESIWREIREVFDVFEKNRKRLNLTSDEGVNNLREFVIPDAISEYKRLRDELSQIRTYSYSDLEDDKNNLISICDYKIKIIQGIGSYYHARQALAFNLETSQEEYENARFFCEDAREIISETHYRTIYDDYVYQDDLMAQECIMAADRGNSRMPPL